MGIIGTAVVGEVSEMENRLDTNKGLCGCDCGRGFLAADQPRFFIIFVCHSRVGLGLELSSGGGCDGFEENDSMIFVRSDVIKIKSYFTLRERAEAGAASINTLAFIRPFPSNGCASASSLSNASPCV